MRVVGVVLWTSVDYKVGHLFATATIWSTYLDVYLRVLGIWATVSSFSLAALALLSPGVVAFSRWCSRFLRVHGGALDRRRLDGQVELGPRFALATSPSLSIWSAVTAMVWSTSSMSSSSARGLAETWLDHVRRFRVEGLAVAMAWARMCGFPVPARYS